ncbi:hypothetical protein [Oceanobacillus sp. CFH 90083]|uniref:hypothetical protein n=1 Tax=Oceanobacillus sp. CFH 90083 TaxID=2592336 RepID=UPI00128C1588|nr:hypothetical protein [Oceanobacillus sp. CFH 90083]
MKHYQYTTVKFLTTVLLPVIIMIGLLLWGTVLFLSGEQMTFAQVLIYGSSILLFFSIAGIHTPSWIKLDDEKIIVHAFFVTHTFYWRDLSFVQLRVYKQTGKLYIRLGTNKIIKGRYWIHSDIKGFDELFEQLKSKSFVEKKISSVER